MSTSTNNIVRSDEVTLENSLKHANTGKVGSFNQFKRAEFQELEDGTVLLNVFSQKISAPGYVMKFSPADWNRFKNTVRRFDTKKVNGNGKK